MIKTRKEKEEFVSYLTGRLEKSNALILVDYKGLQVKDVNNLRINLKKAEGEYKVVKNTLAKLALNSLNIGVLDKYLEGPTAIVLPVSGAKEGKEYIVDMAKVLVNFTKENKNLKIKAGLLNGKEINISDVEAISNLPSREILLGQLLGGLQSPIYGFVFALKQIIGKLVYSLEAIIEKKNKEEKK